MKKVILLASVFALVGCGTANVDPSLDDQIQDDLVQTEDMTESDCLIGEVYSFDELGFGICSLEDVTLGQQEGNLQPILMGTQKVADLVSGDFESEFLKVSYDELLISLENNLFGGIEAMDDNGFGMNYIDIDGNDVIEVEMLGDNQGYRRYFSLIEGDIFRYDDKFNVLGLVSGVIVQ